jgi:hypothetical protein
VQFHMVLRNQPATEETGTVLTELAPMLIQEALDRRSARLVRTYVKEDLLHFGE